MKIETICTTWKLLISQDTLAMEIVAQPTELICTNSSQFLCFH